MTCTTASRPLAVAKLLNAMVDAEAPKLVIAGEQARVTREVDGGLQTIGVTLPAIVTAELRLNEPRYPSLPNLMRGTRRPRPRPSKVWPAWRNTPVA